MEYSEIHSSTNLNKLKDHVSDGHSSTCKCFLDFWSIMKFLADHNL